MFKSFCPAKINLFLKITGKKDNYHELESLFAFLDLADELLVEKSEKFSLEISGEFSDLVDEKDNLFTKILNHFVEKFAISSNLKIKIVKNIPVGAGLGGGSSNAAFFMKALNEIFVLNLTIAEMQEISLNFGSDIAFLLQNKASIVRGRGEIITNYLEFATIPALLINPKIFISTTKIFQDFDGNFSAKIDDSELLKQDVLKLTKNLENDLEKPAILNAKIIGEILKNLKSNKAKIA
ncbi:MAG: 4-(cytidine 5'-diphospho)-2-C-methyl-D-erythritol kinase, partial [Pelagibacterales bacterium]|nr:4-(cytidine 5'-diphospho)-2-C-methyl-D-erythritol kinase [Pelagibacterales bacterium]